MMKRKRGEEEEEEDGGVAVKTTLILRDFSLNPSCPHGPTVLFARGDQTRFFACSAFRSRKLCDFYLSEDKWKGSEDKAEEKGDMKSMKKKRQKKCDDSLTSSEPLEVPNQRDKGEAQYHFTEKTVEFFVNTFESLGFDGVLCVGTPSLYEHISRLSVQDKKRGKLKSFLLDIDRRFAAQYSTNFALYNMCNHHFFEEGGRESYFGFLRSTKRVAIVTDPPFGAKVELVWNGSLKSIMKDIEAETSVVNSHKQESSAECFWIFPYFMEGHILSKCQDSTFRMSDFKVTYRNHKKFSEKGSCGKPSAVRVFTTVPLSRFQLPEDSYRFCTVCDKWVDKLNVHCNLCKTCTTKDGGNSYIHCKKCKKCVKPTWSHCDFPCGTCHLKDNCLAEKSQGSPQTAFPRNNFRNSRSNNNQKKSQSGKKRNKRRK